MSTMVSESATISRELLTAGEFLDWLEPGRHADLIDGEVYMHSPVNFRHARMINFLDCLVRCWLERANFGGELHREVIAVRLGQRTVLMPDLAWFDAVQTANLPDTHAPFASKWVVEVLSPRTAARDTGPKFAAYEQHGVEEYWGLDPESHAHRFYTRGAVYFEEFDSESQWITSRVLTGFKVKRDWLCLEKRPSVTAALMEMGIE